MIYATEQQVVVTSALVILVGLFAFTIGLWVGHGKRDEEEEAALVRAVTRYPEGSGRHRTDADASGVLLELPPRVGAYGPFPVPEDELPGLHEWHDHAPLKWDDEGVKGCESCEKRWEAVTTPAEPGIPDASVTAWTRAMAADMDLFIEGMVEDSNVNQHLIRARS